jgi:outer membrane receptor protein involved in Fe transport
MPLSRRITSFLALALLLAAAPAEHARAEESDLPTPQGDVAPPPGIEAIEVTGERLDDANVQDEAQAITAFTGEQLERANIVNVESLQFNVPGLHVGQSASTPIITLRGIGTENASLSGEPGVAFHVDGINLSRPGAARVAFFDLETLDVKRGPQGLEGGKNSTSGSINLVTRKPTDEYEVSGDVLFGNYDRVRWRGALNVPIGEYMATRVALYSEQRDGYLDNVLVSDSHDPFDADDFGLRAHLRANPSESLELLLSYNYFKQDGVGPQSDVVPVPLTHSCQGSLARVDARTGAIIPAGQPVIIRSSMPSGAVCFNLTGTPSQTNTFPPRLRYRHPFTDELLPSPARGVFDPTQIEDTDPRKVYLTNTRTLYTNPGKIPQGVTDLVEGQRNRYWGWTATLDWAVPSLPLLGETQLKVLGGFQRTEQVFGQDFDATDRPSSGYSLDPDVADQYSGELQWTGSALEERLDWKASLFHLHEQAERDVNAPVLVPEVEGGLYSFQSTDNKSYGTALHGGFQLSDSLRFNLGGRLIKDRKSTLLFREARVSPTTVSLRFRGCEGDLGDRGARLGERNPYTGQLYDVNHAPVKVPPDCSDTYRGRTWGAGLEWRPFGDDHLLYAKIDRGYKSGGFRAATVGKYLPERIWAYASGIKSEFFDQRVRVNLEGFFYNYEAMQLVILDGFSLRTENSDARMYGWDLEAKALPIDGLELSAVVSFLKTETLEYRSLDPTLTPPISGVSPQAWASWHLKRLAEREEAEVAEAAGEVGPHTRYETRSCFRSPNELQLGEVACGRLNESTEPGAFGDYIRSSVGGLDDFSGNELSRAPKWKVTLSGGYDVPLGRFGTLTPHVQYTWSDDTYFRVFNTDFDLQDAYHLTDAKLIWRSPEEVWSVEVFVQNIEDEAAKLNVLIGPRQFGAPPYAWYTPPRFYGVQVGLKY